MSMTSTAPMLKINYHEIITSYNCNRLNSVGLSLTLRALYKFTYLQKHTA